MILLDTQILIWIRIGDGRLGKRALRRIDRALQQGDMAVSAISFWEIAMLQEKGRLEIRQDVAAWRRNLLRDGLVEIPVDGATGIRATRLPGFHSDPADRLIVATALEGHRLLTADRRILDWPGKLNRIDASV
ncbi:type II toxin-antitoxin system VapC family toxin [Candidatus Palauibacter sp.]|uniref:type II toxin-antitoxin system VapC family toxin n=1 Tax=Candidatus Palauibacter sp. TaxID=3101350 RepID=UPI003B5A7624